LKIVRLHSLHHGFENDTCEDLGFYWLGHVALLAYQEKFAPFDSSSLEMRDPVARYQLIKHWIKQIQSFLKTAEGQPTKFWDELMKIRLQSWQWEANTQPDTITGQGIAGFFDEED
jgi:hypothetical protein